MIRGWWKLFEIVGIGARVDLIEAQGSGFEGCSLEIWFVTVCWWKESFLTSRGGLEDFPSELLTCDMTPARPRVKKIFLQRFPAIKIPFSEEGESMLRWAAGYLFIITASSRLVSIFSVEKEVQAAVMGNERANFSVCNFPFIISI